MRKKTVSGCKRYYSLSIQDNLSESFVKSHILKDAENFTGIRAKSFYPEERE